MAVYLGIDVGTQSLKALLFDPERGILGVTGVSLRCREGLPPGHSEQDPEDWIAALRRAVPEVLDRAGVAAAEVIAMGVSGQQHGLVLLDADGRVVRPAKLWNDVSAAAQCEAVRAELGAQRLFDRTGNLLPPGFTGGKIRWIHEREPEHWERTRRILLPHDYVNAWLTGHAFCEPADASGTGYFDVRSRRFVPEVMELLAPGIAPRLPKLLEPGEVGGTLREEAAAALGLQPGTLVSTGGGDNMMAAIGAGAVEPGIVVLSLGTSGTVFGVAESPICDPQGEIAAFCDATGHWLPLGCTMNATVSTELTRQALGLTLQQFEELATATSPGAEGVLCLPFFTGERSPDLPAASGAFLGLRPDNFDAGCLARAAMEGATFALARLLDRLVELGLTVRELRLTGGGSRSPLWRRILASACDQPVSTGVEPEAAALGAAIHALWTHRRTSEPGLSAAACVAELGLHEELETVAPEPEWTATYRARRMVYEQAVAALAPVWEPLRTGGIASC